MRMPLPIIKTKLRTLIILRVAEVVMAISLKRVAVSDRKVIFKKAILKASFYKVSWIS